MELPADRRAAIPSDPTRFTRPLTCGSKIFNVDTAVLALALRYRTTAERSFYKALAELQRVQALICRNARCDEQEEEEEEDAVQREIERLVMAPFARTPQFVSQNHSATTSEAAGTLRHLKCGARFSVQRRISVRRQCRLGL
jgi:hypothetical protein